MSNDSKVIVALDYKDFSEAQALIEKLDPAMCKLKVGKHMFTRFGPAFVKHLISKGFTVFLDLKFHDIPNTVADACVACADLGVWMINVHVQGGLPMLKAARAAIDQLPSEKRPLLIGVTVLTSLVQADLRALGMETDLSLLVERYAKIAKEAGLDGVVCSAQEASGLRKTLGHDFLLVTPGIRLIGDEQSDQKRVVTPRAALDMGSDYLVIGRSITHAKDPMIVLSSILKEIK